MSQAILDALIDILRLETQGNDTFVGMSEDLGFKNVFGGQVCAQALMAAYRTTENRLAHSLHGYFLSPGDHTQAIVYSVERIRDGGSFSARRVIAKQGHREIFSLTASFQEEESGFEHQFEKPERTEADHLTSELSLRRAFKDRIPESVREQFTRDRPIEIRPVNPIDYGNPDVRAPYKSNWFRAIGHIPFEDQALQQCIVAYASDFGLLGTSLLPHGVSFAQRGMRVASIDHAIWFHRPIQADQWMLYDMDSPSASGGRGFNRGSIYDLDGQLVASVAQEALIRRRKSD